MADWKEWAGERRIPDDVANCEKLTLRCRNGKDERVEWRFLPAWRTRPELWGWSKYARNWDIVAYRTE